jgi:hypothetical protein
MGLLCSSLTRSKIAKKAIPNAKAVPSIVTATEFWEFPRKRPTNKSSCPATANSNISKTKLPKRYRHPPALPLADQSKYEFIFHILDMF